MEGWCLSSVVMHKHSTEDEIWHFVVYSSVSATVCNVEIADVGMAAVKDGSASFAREDILDVMSLKNVSKNVMVLLEDMIEKEVVKFFLPQLMLMEAGG